MPVGVVRTPEDEIAWERAKARAREQYPDVSGDRFYRIVMSIYKKMTHYQPLSERQHSGRGKGEAGNRRWRSSLLVVIMTIALASATTHAASQKDVCDEGADFALGIEDYPSAIHLHEEILKRDPQNSLAHYHLGFALGMRGEHAGELREYLRAGELGLREWDFYLNLGIAWMERQQFEEAIEALTQARELGPRHAETHFNLALALERAGRLPEALNEISESLALEPSQEDAKNELAVIHAEMGDRRMAAAIWAALSQADPGDTVAATNLSVLCASSDPVPRECMCSRNQQTPLPTITAGL